MSFTNVLYYVYTLLLQVLKLHTKLGKPIPSDNPTVIQPAGVAPSGPTALKKVPLTKNNSAPGNTFVKPAPPKISFLGPKPDYDRYHTGSGSQGSSDNGSITTAENSQLMSNTAYPASVVTGTGNSVTNAQSESKAEIEDTYVEKDVEPVGVDYIEEIRTEDGNGIYSICFVLLYFELLG
jgi:hypothetical protein